MKKARPGRSELFMCDVVDCLAKRAANADLPPGWTLVRDTPDRHLCTLHTKEHATGCELKWRGLDDRARFIG